MRAALPYLVHDVSWFAKGFNWIALMQADHRSISGFKTISMQQPVVTVQLAQELHAESKRAAEKRENADKNIRKASLRG